MPSKIATFPVYLTKCGKCFERPILTDWRCPDGIDPDLRQYKCPRCGFETYVYQKGSRSADLKAIIREYNDKKNARKK